MSAPKLVYSEAELLESHDYAAPQIESGHRLHGGYDEAGRYISPRKLHRAPAIEHWAAALEARGGELMQADASLLSGVRYPTLGQLRLLLHEGLGQAFWNMLTTTGVIEGRGRVLAEMTFPDLQDVIVEDISRMGIGHLHRGLLKAHGLDEGGEPAAGIGGHDVMWFALRDLAFGDAGFPQPEVDQNIARPDDDRSTLPPISEPHLRTIYFLLNLLLIEFRAEIFFAIAQALLRDPGLFTARHQEAQQAAEIVERIRTDEEIHVTSLRLYLGEIRSCTFRTLDGGTLPGHAVVDDFWRRICEWATVEQPRLRMAQSRELFRKRIAGHPEAERVQREFDALEDHAA
jgi:hypothetical protein